MSPLPWIPNYSAPPTGAFGAAGGTGTPVNALRPTKSGWHLLEFTNGAVAVLRYDGGQWQWGSRTAPQVPVSRMVFLGGDANTMALNLGQQFGNLSAAVAATLSSQIDTGALGRGQPVVVSPTGSLQAGTLRNQGGATPINQIPSPIPPSVGNTGGGFFGDISGAIGSVTDFLKWIAWIFHPLNLLRAVEFVTGVATMFYGLSTLMRRQPAPSTLGRALGTAVSLPWKKASTALAVRRERKAAKGAEREPEPEPSRNGRKPWDLPTTSDEDQLRRWQEA